MLQLRPDALDLGPESLVHHEHPGARLVEHAAQRIAPQPRIDAEQRGAGIRAATIERQELQVVLEQHRDVRGTLVVDRTQPATEQVCHPDGLVAIATVGPGAIVLAQEDALPDFGVGAARLDLGADQERGVERRCGHE